ncbi:MAG TPA: energy transducer TonB, partial [Rhodanobacter sp.]
VLLAAMLLPTLVCAEDKVATTPPITVQVQVDAQGHLGAITPMQKLGEPYASLVQRTLAGWSFYPARIQGKPVVTTTWLTIEMTAQPRGNGDFEVHVVYLGNGPYTKLSAPSYPGDMLRERREAKLVALATIGIDGKFSDVRIAQSQTSDGVSARDFIDSVRDMLKRAKAHPIIVDGEPVVSHISFPIIYHIDVMNETRGTPDNLATARDSAKFIAAKPASDEKIDAQANAMVTLDSPVSPVSPRSLPGS